MIELNDLIQIYDNALDFNVCDFLVNFFESNPDKQEIVNNDKKPNFTQLNLTEHCKVSPEVDNVHNFLISKVFEYKRKYYEFIDDRCFPEKHNFEQFRIKKYNPGGDDLFDTHVDILDHNTSRRYLSFLWYLNDVDEGGETVFTGLKIKPQKGKLLVFPPMWMFPHRGEAPISNTKYIMSVYLHYR